MLGRPTVLWATLVVVLLGGAAPSAHAADDSGTVVLGVEAADTQDNNLASDVTDAIKQRVATGKGGPLIPGKDLVEIKLVFSCSDEAPACLAQAGKSLGAAKLIYGTIKRSGGDVVLTLKQVDTARGTVDGTTVENLAKKKLDPSALRALSGQWMARLSGAKSGGGGGTPGTLMVRSNVSGATVMLDGAEVGTLTHKSLSIENVSPGKHEITVEKPGFGVSTQVFTIGSGQALPLTLTLLRGDGNEGDDGATAPAPAGEPDATAHRIPAPADDVPGDGDSLRSWMRAGFWVSMGVSAVSFGLAAKYGLDVRSVNQDLNPYRQPNPTKEDPSKTIVPGLLDKGNSAETRQWIFIGVGSAAAVAGGFLLYKGYLDKEAGSGSKTADNHGLRVFPTANTSSGGIAAEFDF